MGVESPTLAAHCADCGAELPARAKFCPECGRPCATHEHGAELGARKVVTALFCDLVGSTSLGESRDPELMQQVLRTYYTSMRDVLVRHGGTLQKFIGDAVVAFFGLPVLHEDDALRALRAAAEMQQRIAELNAAHSSVWGLELAVRIGVNTGEVMTGLGDAVATGDALNTAARLEQAAGPGEVYVGFATAEAAGELAVLEPLPALVAKGKADPVPCFRLDSVAAPGTRRSSRGRLVGRTAELAALQAAYADVVAHDRVKLATVLGDAGVGKSRLVDALVESLDGITVARGRCLHYGDAVAYWPLVEIVKELDGVDVAPDVRAVLDDLLGAGGARSSSDLAWATSRLVLAAAAHGPVVLVVDDLQWAQPAFLDLVRSLADERAKAPVLVLCLARPELTDRVPDWPVLLRLAPLQRVEAAELVRGQLTALPEGSRDAVVEQVLAAAGGNALFLEEMTNAVLRTPGDAAGALRPASLQALLAAQLEQLPAAERRLLQVASVEGEVFHPHLVGVMLDRTVTGEEFERLVERDFLRREAGHLAGEHALRFHHLLLRDAAYESLPKAARATMHERLARSIGEQPELLGQGDALAGHHFESAHRYRVELRMLGPETDEIARLGAERLVAAGARLREEPPLAIPPLQRALELVDAQSAPVPRLRGSLLVYLGRARYGVRDYDGALAAARAILDDAGGDTDADIRAAALNIAGWARRSLGDVAAGLELRRAAEAALAEAPVTAIRLDLTLSLASFALFDGRHAQALARIDDALQLAEELGRERSRAEALRVRSMIRCVLGEPGGLDDARAALALAAELGLGNAQAQCHNTLGYALGFAASAPATLAAYEAGQAFCLDRGLPAEADFLEFLTIDFLIRVGDLVQAHERYERVMANAQRNGDALLVAWGAMTWAPLQALEGNLDEARELLDRHLQLNFRSEEGEAVALALGAAMWVDWLSGVTSDVNDWLGRLERLDAAAVGYLAWTLPAASRFAAAVGAVEVIDRLVQRVGGELPLVAASRCTAEAAAAEARGEHHIAAGHYADAIRRWEDYGDVIEASLARFGAARCLRATGEVAAGARLRSEAEVVVRRIGAAGMLRAADSLAPTTP